MCHLVKNLHGLEDCRLEAELLLHPEENQDDFLRPERDARRKGRGGFGEGAVLRGASLFLHQPMCLALVSKVRTKDWERDKKKTL